MNRSTIFILIVLAALAAVILYSLTRPAASTTNSTVSGIKLVKPATFCPRLADVVVTKTDGNQKVTVLSSLTAAVKGCQLIDWPTTVTSAEERQVFVKIPGALAFKVVVADRSATVEHGLAIGDVNNDNTIDSQDKNAVEEALRSGTAETLNQADVDGDGKISIFDLSLAALNQGSGVAHPKTGSWGE